MVFSEEPGTLVLGEVSQRLHLPDDTVKRILHSLSCGKYKVLKREGEGGSIKATDKVCTEYPLNAWRLAWYQRFPLAYIHRV